MNTSKFRYTGKDKAFGRRFYAEGGDVEEAEAAPDNESDEGGGEAEENTNPGTADYDYDSWMAAGSPADERGHGPDTYKQPNHMTFSDESQLSGSGGNEGGKWEKLPGKGSVEGQGEPYMFTAGKTNLQHHTPQEMQRYFNRVEPNSVLKLPDARVVGD